MSLFFVSLIFTLWSARTTKSTIWDSFLLPITRFSFLVGIRWSVCISKRLRIFVRIVHQDGFWFVHIPSGSNFKFLAQFPVDHLPYPVMSSLIYMCVCVYICIDSFICPVGWGCRIHRLHICRGVTLPYECPGYGTKESDDETPVMLELWECGVPLHCHCSQFQCGLE